MDAIQLVKRLEVYRPFFIEDPFAPEDIGYFRVLRQQSATPIAMGELFNLNYAVRPNGADHQWGKDPLK
jgi:mannonate dehydratase